MEKTQILKMHPEKVSREQLQQIASWVVLSLERGDLDLSEDPIFTEKMFTLLRELPSLSRSKEQVGRKIHEQMIVLCEKGQFDRARAIALQLSTACRKSWNHRIDLMERLSLDLLFDPDEIQGISLLPTEERFPSLHRFCLRVERLLQELNLYEEEKEVVGKNIAHKIEACLALSIEDQKKMPSIWHKRWSGC